MSDWSNNNRAHTSLWFFESYHHGNATGFDHAKTWTCGYLTGVVAGDGPEMIASKARAHAVLLDEAFTKLYRATYEPGVTQQETTLAFETVLTDTEKTIVDLAKVVDDKLKFNGEV